MKQDRKNRSSAKTITDVMEDINNSSLIVDIHRENDVSTGEDSILNLARGNSKINEQIKSTIKCNKSDNFLSYFCRCNCSDKYQKTDNDPDKTISVNDYESGVDNMYSDISTTKNNVLQINKEVVDKNCMDDIKINPIGVTEDKYRSESKKGLGNREVMAQGCKLHTSNNFLLELYGKINKTICEDDLQEKNKENYSIKTLDDSFINVKRSFKKSIDFFSINFLRNSYLNGGSSSFKGGNFFNNKNDQITHNFKKIMNKEENATTEKQLNDFKWSDEDTSIICTCKGETSKNYNGYNAGVIPLNENKSNIIGKIKDKSRHSLSIETDHSAKLVKNICSCSVKSLECNNNLSKGYVKVLNGEESIEFVDKTTQGSEFECNKTLFVKNETYEYKQHKAIVKREKENVESRKNQKCNVYKDKQISSKEGQNTDFGGKNQVSKRSLKQCKITNSNLSVENVVYDDIENRRNKILQFSGDTVSSVSFDTNNLNKHLYLPKKYLRLSRIYKTLLTIQKYHENRSLTSIYIKVKESVERVLKTRIELSDIEQINYILRGCATFKRLEIDHLGKRIESFTMYFAKTPEYFDEKIFEHFLKLHSKLYDSKNIKKVNDDEIPDIPVRGLFNDGVINADGMPNSLENLKNDEAKIFLCNIKKVSVSPVANNPSVRRLNDNNLKADNCPVKVTQNKISDSGLPVNKESRQEVIERAKARTSSILEKIRAREAERKKMYVNANIEEDLAKMTKKILLYFKKEKKRAIKISFLVDVFKIFDGNKTIERIAQNSGVFQIREINGDNYLVYEND